MSSSNYFEKRKYTRQEIAEILELDPRNKNFSRSVQTKLRNLGFTEEQYIYTSKEITILWVPQTYEEKITYLVRLLGIDKQVDPIIFATFLYHLALNGEYECNKMPWVEKADWLEKQLGLNVSERTLRKWTTAMIDKGILTKYSDDYQWWCSMRLDNGSIIRFPVVTGEEKQRRLEYNKFCADLLNLSKTNAMIDQSTVFAAAWQRYNCRYYKCCSTVLCAWENNPIMQELRDLILEHFNK